MLAPLLFSIFDLILLLKRLFQYYEAIMKRKQINDINSNKMKFLTLSIEQRQQENESNRIKI